MNRDRELKNTAVLDYLKTHKIKSHFIIINNPQSNEAIERFHFSLIEYLRNIRAKNKGKIGILNNMPYTILGYNNSVHSTTKQKPEI